VGLGDKFGLKSDGDTQCLNDLVGDGDDGAEVIEKFKCSGSYTLGLPCIPPGCLPNCPPSSGCKIKKIFYTQCNFQFTN